jgi:hypothetical protein
MTSQTGKHRRGWRSAVTGALAVGLMAGFGAPTALAEPEPTPVTDAQPRETEAPATPTMTADQALAIIANEYDTGAGGGQLSNLIHDVLTLRAQGFMPSNGNKMAIQKALEKRPNQTPLIEALKQTLNYQLTLKSRQAVASTPPSEFTVGGGQTPPGQMPPGQMSPGQMSPRQMPGQTNPGIFGPSGGITLPIG